MFSDEISENYRKLIQIYVDNLPFSEYYKDEIIQMIACAKYIDAKCLDSKKYSKEIALLDAKNEIDRIIFKNDNCKCEITDWCDMCFKYEKNIYVFITEIEMKNSIFEMLDNIKNDLINFNNTDVFIAEYLNKTINTSKEYNINIYDKLEEIYITFVYYARHLTHLNTVKLLKQNIKNIDKLNKIVVERRNNFTEMLFSNLGEKKLKNKQIEKEIQKRLCKELKNAQIEVKTPNGFIDILTDNEIIEIKNGKNWKDAVGQILIYSTSYPNHIKRIHLFNIKKDKNIEKACEIYNILVTFDEN